MINLRVLHLWLLNSSLNNGYHIIKNLSSHFHTICVVFSPYNFQYFESYHVLELKLICLLRAHLAKVPRKSGGTEQERKKIFTTRQQQLSLCSFLLAARLTVEEELTKRAHAKTFFSSLLESFESSPYIRRSRESECGERLSLWVCYTLLQNSFLASLSWKIAFAGDNFNFVWT